MNDSNLQQLLLQTEVTPPEMVWEKITLTLDEQQADQPLQQKILQFEEEVPALVWNNLEADLNDLALQKKIESIEVSSSDCLSSYLLKNIKKAVSFP